MRITCSKQGLCSVLEQGGLGWRLWALRAWYKEKIPVQGDRQRVWLEGEPWLVFGCSIWGGMGWARGALPLERTIAAILWCELSNPRPACSKVSECTRRTSAGWCGGSALGQAGVWGGALWHLDTNLCCRSQGTASAKLGVGTVLFTGTSEGTRLGSISINLCPS